MKKTFDMRLMEFYAPIHNNAIWFEESYLPQTSGIFRKVLIAIGNKVPRKCWFKQKFKLNWTPCMLNPFFLHLLALAEFAALDKYMNNIENYTEEFYANFDKREN